MRSRGSTWWSGCGEPTARGLGTSGPTPRCGAEAPSFDFFVRVHAPQPILLDPAVESLAGEAAPSSRAALDGTEHPRLQARDGRAAGIGFAVERQQFVFGLRLRGDHGSAAARK